VTDRVCQCGCGRSLAHMRSDARWASRACAVRWARLNPGISLYEALNTNRERTRERSGRKVSVVKTAPFIVAEYGGTLERAEATLCRALPQALQERNHA
jgi:hypothetical protein